MIIENSVMADAVEIARLYESARDLQKIKGAVCWPLFDKKLIETEITEGRHWKIVIDTQIACVWATTFSDPQIWEERNADASVYIHRIATNPIYRGQNLVKEIVRWAKVYAEKNEKEFIRLDTVGENKELIRHYQKCGFDFLGIFNLTNTDQLPAHYHNAGVSLFQMKVN